MSMPTFSVKSATRFQQQPCYYFAVIFNFCFGARKAPRNFIDLVIHAQNKVMDHVSLFCVLVMGAWKVYAWSARLHWLLSFRHSRFLSFNLYEQAVGTSPHDLFSFWYNLGDA